MKFTSLLAMAVTTVASLAGAQQQRAQSMQSAHAPSNVVVARVNDAPLYQRDVNMQMQALFPYYSIHGGSVPASAQKELRQKALDRLVLEELVYQEAKQRGIQISPAQVEARVKVARAKADSPEEFEASVAKAYGSQEQFRKYAQRALMIEKLWEQEVTRPSRPTEAAVQRYYRENRDRFTRPESVSLQTISFQFQENTDLAKREAVRKSAEELLPKAQAAGSVAAFGALAEKYSTDDWRVMNGDHGWIHRGTVDPELDLAFSMKTGEVSKVIASKAGYHILRVNGYRAAQPAAFVEVKTSVREILKKESETRLREKFEQSLRQNAKVQMQ